MVEKVVWTEKAVQDRFEIYRYWAARNRSSTYSEKLEALFKRYGELIAAYPEIGVKTSLREVRYRVVRDYKLFYKIEGQVVLVLRVWDVRQNPGHLKME